MTPARRNPGRNAQTLPFPADRSGVTFTSTVAQATGPRTHARSREPKPYDFRRPNKLNRAHVRTLHIAYETFCRQFTTVLTSTLGVFSLVELVAVEQMSYVDYVESLPTPTFLALISLDPLQGTGILQLPLETAMLCVDRVLGGPGSAQQPTRLPTDVEAEIMKMVTRRAVQELRYAFEGLVQVSPDVIGIETNPQFAQAAVPSDIVVVASLEIKVGDQDGAATLMIPFIGLYPVLEAAASPKRGDRRDLLERSQAALRARLEDIEIEVAVQFPYVALTPHELLNLSVGDVLSLRHPTNAPLLITAEGIPFAYAVPGSNGRQAACLVVEPPQEGGTAR